MKKTRKSRKSRKNRTAERERNKYFYRSLQKAAMKKFIEEQKERKAR